MATHRSRPVSSEPSSFDSADIHACLNSLKSAIMPLNTAWNLRQPLTYGPG